MIGPLHEDVFNQSKYMLNGVDESTSIDGHWVAMDFTKEGGYLFDLF